VCARSHTHRERDDGRSLIRECCSVTEHQHAKGARARTHTHTLTHACTNTPVITRSQLYTYAGFPLPHFMVQSCTFLSPIFESMVQNCTFLNRMISVTLLPFTNKIHFSSNSRLCSWLLRRAAPTITRFRGHHLKCCILKINRTAFPLAMFSRAITVFTFPYIGASTRLMSAHYAMIVEGRAFHVKITQLVRRLVPPHPVEMCGDGKTCGYRMSPFGDEPRLFWHKLNSNDPDRNVWSIFVFSLGFRPRRTLFCRKAFRWKGA